MDARPAPPIVVVGCPRSGTTLLQVALHAHRRIAIPPETWLLVEGYRARAQFGDLRTAEGRDRFEDWLTGQRKVRDLGLSRAELHALVAGAAPTLGSLLAAVLQGYSARFGKPRWGDKRPSYYRDVEVVLRLFPDAQFVHVVRDARACIASLERLPWYTKGPDAALSMWCTAIDRGERWKRRLGPERWHELQYEHLLAEPERELRRLCAFLGEEFDPAMLEPAATAAVAVPARKTWHRRTRGPLDLARIAAYREELPPAQLALVERVAGRRLRRYGYPVGEAACRVPLAALARYAWVGAHRRLTLHRQHLADRWGALRLRDAVARR